MKFCAKCGSQIPDDAQFCGECGAKVVEEKNISQSTTKNSLPSVSSNGIVLESDAPIPSRLTDRFLSDGIAALAMLGGIVGVVLQFIDDFQNIGKVLLVINWGGIFVSYIIDYSKGHTPSKDLKLMLPHLEEIRETKYKFVYGVSATELYGKNSAPLKNYYGDDMEFDRQSDTVSLVFKQVTYKIILNDDATFSIWWIKNDNKPFPKPSLFLTQSKLQDAYDVYNEIIQRTAVIAYEIQKQFGVN